MLSNPLHGKSWYSHYLIKQYYDPSEAAKEALTALPVMTGRQRRTARRKFERKLYKK